MGARFVNVDREAPMLFPVDMRDWIPENHPVHFMIEAVEALGLQSFQVNERGTGNGQYHPVMMPSLLMYCYSNGRFQSRKIEDATYADAAVRYVCGGRLHPDHGTICKFRRENGELFKECFVKALGMARELGVLKRPGGISMDGTKIRASAGKAGTFSHGKAGELIERLGLEVDALIRKAEEADRKEDEELLSIPEAISRRESRIGKLKEARRMMEEQYERKKKGDREEYEKKLEAVRKRKGDGEVSRSLRPKGPRKKALDEFLFNPADPESRLMRRSDGTGFEQLYNAQMAVDGEGSRLVPGKYVTDRGNDLKGLRNGAESVDMGTRKITGVLADGGYFNDELIEAAEDGAGIKVYAPPGKSFDPAEVRNGSPLRKEMFERLQTKDGKEKRKERRQISEPVFGIIKEAMGFRKFLMRGLAKVNVEWDLISLAYDFKRLFRILGNPGFLKPAGA
jgi:transposase